MSWHKTHSDKCLACRLRVSCYEFSSARRVGKKNATLPRPILINLKHFQDVEIIHRYKGPYQFQAYEDKSRSGFHLKFCKTSLNVSIYASNSAVLGELGRYPMTFTCLIQVIKYWIRLSNETKNELMNSAFKMATIENNSWIQAIYFMLSSNGYIKSCLYPPGVDGNFHGAHLGPVGPRWAPCCPHKHCYQGWYWHIEVIYCVKPVIVMDL